PDGYTLLVTAATMAVSPAAYPKLPYDVLRDFAPVTLLAQSPYVLAVNPALPASSVADLLRLSRTSPQRLNFGSPGNGTLSHLAFELLRSRTGLQAEVVPYKGSNPALLDAIGGQVDFILDTPAAVGQHLKSQKLRALAVTSAQRAASMPSVPSIGESVPGYDVSVWFGLLTPAGTPPDILQKIRADVIKVLGSPALAERLQAAGLDVTTSTPSEFASLLRTDVGKWSEVVKQANIKFD
ncbi:MAG: hypothetical protein JWQ72_3239, partial [Polaromonas sp.]|nr:hypothetical protein [Polaromonas sp.]